MAFCHWPACALWRSWFRTDLILDYRSQIHAIGSGGTNCFINVDNPTPFQPNPRPATCTGHFDSEIRRWDLLANGYLDLGTWDGFTPYVGVGAGVAWARINQSVNFTFNGLAIMHLTIHYGAMRGATF